MKKTLMFFGLLAILTACTSGTKEETAVVADSTAVVACVDSVPCADSLLLDTTLVLTPTVSTSTVK